jgi:chaperonin GroEL
VTVSKQVELVDPFGNMGAKLVNEVASKMGDKAGDGTTTGSSLAEAVFTGGLRYVTAGASPVALKRGIDRRVEAAGEALKALAKPVRGLDDLTKVATISANRRRRDRLHHREGHRSRRQGRRRHTSKKRRAAKRRSTLVKGMSFDKGYISPYFVTGSRRSWQRCRNAYILIHGEELERPPPPSRCSKPSPEQGAPLLIVAEDIEGDALLGSRDRRAARRAQRLRR